MSVQLSHVACQQHTFLFVATGGHQKYIMLTFYHGIKNDLANVKTLKDDPRGPFEVRLKGRDFTTLDSKVIAAATISCSALTAAR